MNTYNENLHSNVVSSLQDLELDLKAKQSALDASAFTLYYAEGARLTAVEKLDKDMIKYNAQEKIKKQAVINNNISINLLDSANQQKQFTAQAVTNAAVCASNIQIASNAIVKLASDIAGVFSILNAADYHSEIYRQGKEAYDLINMTAYDVEKVSQDAMDASKLMAEVTSSTVADEAKATNASMTTILNTANSAFDALASAVTDDHKSISAASASEKKAEGVLEFRNAEYFSAGNAYKINNKELNLNLRVPEKHITNESYVVKFSYYKSPFTVHQATMDLDPKHTKKAKEENKISPVRNYYIMLVKDSSKSTFSMARAESIALNSKQYPKQCIELPGTIDKKEPDEKRDGFAETIYISDIIDSDGDKMELGVQYTVFVLVAFTEDYKKRINNFDDYLSAPSQVFTLTNKLGRSHHLRVPSVTTSHYQKLDFVVEENKDILSDKIKFHKGEELKGDKLKELDVEYRCIFIPDNSEFIEGQLSEPGLRTIESEVERLEKIADKYDPEIAKYDALVTSLESTVQSLDTQIQIAEDKGDPAALKKLKHARSIAHKELIAAIAKRRENKKERDREMSTIEPAQIIKPGFFFNLKLAEQVSAGNYSPVEVLTVVSIDNGIVKLKGSVEIKEDVTDNFGNLLMEKKAYIPVVLSHSKALEENLSQYTNALSKYEETPEFKYQAKKINLKTPTV